MWGASFMVISKSVLPESIIAKLLYENSEWHAQSEKWSWVADAEALLLPGHNIVSEMNEIVIKTIVEEEKEEEEEEEMEENQEE